MDGALTLAMFVFSGLMTLLVARGKGRSWMWFFAGVFLPIVSLLIIIVASDLNEERMLRDEIRELKETLKKDRSA
jgi:hypothetical protein